MGSLSPPVLFQHKTYVESVTPITTVLINQWYTLFTGSCLDLLAFACAQTNTTPQAQLVDTRVTIDGEVFGHTGSNPNSGEVLAFSLDGITTLGTNPTLHEWTPATNFAPFGFITDEAVGGVIHGTGQIMGGHSITIEMRLTDAPGANQQLDMDVIYKKLEAV